MAATWGGILEKRGLHEKIVTVEPFPKPSGSDNKILNHPQGSQAEDGGE
jgi:hypothetical protein